MVGPKVLATLSETPTLQGYNDGLTTLPVDDDYYSPRCDTSLCCVLKVVVFG